VLNMSYDNKLIEMIVEIESTQSYDTNNENPCPNCKTGKMDYDGLLNLYCQNCGYTLAGCFT